MHILESRPQNNSGMRVQDNQDLAPISISEYDWDGECGSNPANQEDNYYDQLGDYPNNPPYYDAESSVSYYEPLWLETNTSTNLNDSENTSSNSEFYCNSIPIRKIQNVSFFVNNKVALLSLDSGCEGDCILESECKRLNIPILPLDSTDTIPTQADGYSPLAIKGKAKFQCERDKIILFFDGYVTTNMQSRILCGASFLTRNKVVQELHNNKIVVQGKYHILESSPLCPNPIPNVQISHIKQQDKCEILNKIYIDKSVPKHLVEKLNGIHKKHMKVFDGDISEGYNGSSGDFKVDFNFLNNVPPRPHLGCVPSYNKPEDDVILQAKIDQLEDMGVVAKARDINIIPRYASPCMLVKKNSIRDLPKGEYEKMKVLDKLKYNRFVLCQDKLNDYIEKIPAKLNKLEDTLRIVGAHEFVITSDLTDSFWQRHVKWEKLPFFAFHSPFKGTYIFLRSCQGFFNQSEGLEEMVSCVLSKFISEGWCRVHADNIYVMGNSLD